MKAAGRYGDEAFTAMMMAKVRTSKRTNLVFGSHSFGFLNPLFFIYCGSVMQIYCVQMVRNGNPCDCL